MKRIGGFLLGLTLFLALLGIGAALFLDSLVEEAVERVGTYALGVETRLESANIGLLSGEFSLRGLEVDNPPGFVRPAFFALRSARMELPASALLGSRITVPSLTLEGVSLALERNSNGTNYGTILDNLERLETRSKTEGPGEGAEGGKAFLLERLAIRDVHVTADLLPTGGDLTKLSLTIPEIVVEDLGSEMTLPEICALAVKLVVQAALESGESVLPEELLADLRKRMDGLKTVAGGRIEVELGQIEEKLQEQARKLGPEAEKALQGAADQLRGKLDGLLDREKDDRKKN
jgi:hypothetical protein